MQDKDQITIMIDKKDRGFLTKLKYKLRKNSLAAVVESVVNLIKLHKLEGELK